MRGRAGIRGVWLICVFALMYVAMTATAIADTGAILPSEIEVELEATKSDYGAADTLNIKVTFRNTSDHPVRFLSWDTPLEGMVAADVLEIEFENEYLVYTGRHSRRPSPKHSDFTELSPGKSVSEVVDIEIAYSLRSAGDYIIRYSGGGASSNSIRLRLSEQRTVFSLSRRSSVDSSCSAQQTATINSDRALTKAAVDIAFADLTEAPVADRPMAERYVYWFNQYSAPRYSEVLLTFDRMKQVLDEQQDDYFCRILNPSDTQFGCRTDEIAFVYPNTPFDVNLCTVHFSYPQRLITGLEISRLGTMIHELSHFAATGDTLDTAAGISGARNLSALQATNNADNFAFFGENFPALSMPKAAPPPQPTPPEPGKNPFIPALLDLLLEGDNSQP